MFKNKSLEKQERTIAWIMVSPALIVLSLVAVYPVLRNFWLSLQQYSLIELDATKFIGLHNYQKIFLDKDALRSIWFTLRFALTTVALELCLGMCFALIMSKSFRGRGLMRTAVLIPWAIPTSVSAVMWKFMLDDQLGFINAVLLQLGIVDKGIVFLGSSFTAFWSLVLTDVWKTTPFVALLLTAGIQSIPETLYEAAQIDGAGSFRSFIYITLPQLKGSIMVTLLFRTMSAFNVFDIINVMTGGANNTESLAIYTYKNLMKFLDFGYGSTLAVIIFLISLSISLVYYKTLGKSD